MPARGIGRLHIRGPLDAGRATEVVGHLAQSGTRDGGSAHTPARPERLSVPLAVGELNPFDAFSHANHQSLAKGGHSHDRPIDSLSSN